ncbi:MAG: UdgX family uracil-DNA binding protein [Verrucomicrobiales bacterium]|nr:UdgX family uracil-DNA binding protein [Verrucomicrobiales bacterium]
MQTVHISRNFDSWRDAAREHLRLGTDPADLFWDDGTASASLFEISGEKPDVPPPEREIRLPKSFIDLARWVACHSDPDRWSLLYRLAWRLAIGNERQLLNLETDDDVRRAQILAKAVRRDRHKMTAFVRFRKTGIDSKTGREQFVAWFEPNHFIVELTAPFFQKRFASMDWSILTPDRCAHWNGKNLWFTDGISKSEAGVDEDQLEDFWRTYYANIFNPARLKLKAMQAEMPVKYWKNLPEAPLICELTREAALRTTDMIDTGVNHERTHVSEKIPKGVPQFTAVPQVDPAAVFSRCEALDIREIRDLAENCRACGICENATQTVFGEGPEDARIMLIGEQPGDGEDIAGRPFVGPAGRLLDEALEDAGLNRDELYITNTVKHFKWKSNLRGGKRRIHDKANRGEIEKCKPWVLAEISKVRPEKIILLGATAAQALLGYGFRVSRQRGLVPAADIAETVIATVHPSSLLRIRDPELKQADIVRFVEDIRLAA